ncbi:helix-turn-helix domain-containing protein [Plantactinospora sp. GCM10030261]|uniref:helix-turn-helix domain-containing protein n=1 Tax=Plantactinospora sp. GCM10030261 TaxID=3273420 RepID=UPI00361ED2F2
MTWVWDHSPAGGNERLVLLAIADNAADDGGNAWPSLGTLARKTRLDERTVRRIIRRLEDAGQLAVAVAAGPGGTNRYTVIMSDGTPGSVPPGQIDSPDIQPDPPGVAVPPSPGHSRAPRTSLNFPKNVQPRSRSLRGAALPANPRAGHCPKHRGCPAGNCGPCRSEALGGAA